MMKKSIYSLKRAEFIKNFPSLSAFRFNQIDSYRKKGIADFDDYKVLDNQTKNLLKNTYLPFSSSVLKTSSGLESSKVLIRLEDDLEIEAVFIKNENHNTACLSSQVGCAMGCKFCATATMGLKRNLLFYEIIEQFYHLKRLFGKIDYIVFMGMGEPLLNLDNVSKAFNFFNNNENISIRHITISTCGIAERIKELADMKNGIKLTFSLHCADQKKREKIMNSAKAYQLEKIKDALLYYQNKNNRRITVAYCMFKGINMEKSDAKNIKKLLRGLNFHLNLIPYTKIDSSCFESPDSSDIKKFTSYLDEENIKWTIRHSKGRDVSSSCGELVIKKG